MTSAITTDELFAKVTAEMSKLLNARGCIIRMIEDERLPVKASYGLSLQTAQDMELRMGEGVA